MRIKKLLLLIFGTITGSILLSTLIEPNNQIFSLVCSTFAYCFFKSILISKGE